MTQHLPDERDNATDRPVIGRGAVASGDTLNIRATVETLCKPEVRIRPATEADLPELLTLMKELAAFEGYLDQFAVTEATLRQQGFVQSPPDFAALVAATEHKLEGMLVYYFIPFTFRARPTCVVKELFVSSSARGHGVGEQLMRAAASAALACGCAAMKWQVAAWNDAASRFYTRMGATADPVWVDYGLTEQAMKDLASR